MTVSVDKKTLKIIFSICVLAVAICIAVCVSEIRATADYSKADGTLVSIDRSIDLVYKIILRQNYSDIKCINISSISRNTQVNIERTSYFNLKSEAIKPSTILLQIPTKSEMNLKYKLQKRVLFSLLFLEL